MSLYKIGGAYFVLDGNHRVSVARYHGVEWIDAEVTEFFALSPLAPTQAGTVEKTKEHTRSEEVPGRGDSNLVVSKRKSRCAGGWRRTRPAWRSSWN